MTTLALSLILTSAVLHASWNLVMKRSGNSGVAFIWLFMALSTLIYSPVATIIYFAEGPQLGMAELGFILASGALQSVYFFALRRGYRLGDFSLVYPVARGSGPLFATIAAVLLFNERPSLLALLGLALISLSVLGLAGNPLSARRTNQPAGLAYAVLTGGVIASYTLTDKYIVSELLVPPLLLHWGGIAFQAAIWSPLAVRRWDQVQVAWRANGRAVLVVAVLAPLAYILVLTALTFTPVSYVAPAREISILIGTLMGGRLLAEGATSQRLAAAGSMVAGVVVLALG